MQTALVEQFLVEPNTNIVYKLLRATTSTITTASEPLVIIQGLPLFYVYKVDFVSCSLFAWSNRFVFPCLNQCASAGRARSMGHSRSGGLRSPPSALLSRHGRHPHVLLHRLARFAGEHPREMASGSEALLPERAHRSRRQQEGSAQRFDHHKGAYVCPDLQSLNDWGSTWDLGITPLSSLLVKLTLGISVYFISLRNHHEGEASLLNIYHTFASIHEIPLCCYQNTPSNQGVWRANDVDMKTIHSNLRYFARHVYVH